MNIYEMVTKLRDDFPQYTFELSKEDVNNVLLVNGEILKMTWCDELTDIKLRSNFSDEIYKHIVDALECRVK